MLLILATYETLRVDVTSHVGCRRVEQLRTWSLVAVSFEPCGDGRQVGVAGDEVEHEALAVAGRRAELLPVECQEDLWPDPEN